MSKKFVPCFILSPDETPFSPEPITSYKELRKAWRGLKERYEANGGYSMIFLGSRMMIPVKELHKYCEIVPAEISKHWEVTGYYKESTPEDLLTVIYREFDDEPNPDTDQFCDEDIYFYGMNEDTIIHCMNNKEDLGGEFIPVSYKEI